MAHFAQQEFCSSIRERFKDLFYPVTLNVKRDYLDVGSLDINGNNRYLFDEPCNYTGVDICEGPNVDIAGVFHTLDWEGKSYDVVVSTEMLEHDRHWENSIQLMWSLVKPGGLLVLTAGGEGRPEHGTRRTTPDDSPFTSKMDDEWADYYHNITEWDIITAIPKTDEFVVYEISHHHESKDIYFVGMKKD